VSAYRKFATAKSDVERQADAKEKTGVFTGAFATNPANGAQIPVFIADYVLAGYGTGAIMAVPGQDERDWEFAEVFDLPIIRTVQPSEGFDGKAFLGDGPAVNSASPSSVDLNGLGVAAAKAKIIDWLEANGHGSGAVTYRLRDWLFSRQRYWGEPFPIVYDETGLPIALPDSMLPVELPDVDDFSPKTFDPDDANTSPETPLSRAREWVEVELDLGDGPRRYTRETNTMPQWAGSCWYELRYLDPGNDKAFVDPENERYWMGPQSEVDCGGVDLYVGGVEHAVLHLLYARFWHKVLFDLGYTSSFEPFRKLFNQGYIQAYAYTDARGSYVPAEEVVEVSPGKFEYNGAPVNREYGKMGKSLRNVVTPDEMCERYGADTFRVYEMSMGPLEGLPPMGDPRRDRLAAVPAAGVAPDRGRGDGPVPDRRRGRGRRDHPAAAPHDRRGPHRHRGAALQHGHRQADRADQPGHRGQRRGHAPGAGRAAGADAGAVRAAPGRGGVAAAGS
jgi:leucyl-tRNA synthetase